MDVFTAPDKISPPTITTKIWKLRRSRYGPLRFMARPPIRLLMYIGRTLSGMIITANSEITPVQSTAYQQVRFVAILRFFILGEAISRYTCASVSKPLIESSECPNAMMITTIGICIQKVPLSQPCALSEKTRLAGLGDEGR